jgi:hypothetical protein
VILNFILFFSKGLVMDFSKKNNSNSSLMYNLEFTNELFLFDLKNKKWNKEPLETKGKVPQKRHFHSCVVYKDNLIVFGGKSNGYLNDVQFYSICLIFQILIFFKQKINGKK